MKFNFLYLYYLFNCIYYNIYKIKFFRSNILLSFLSIFLYTIYFLLNIKIIYNLLYFFNIYFLQKINIKLFILILIIYYNLISELNIFIFKKYNNEKFVKFFKSNSNAYEINDKVKILKKSDKTLNNQKFNFISFIKFWYKRFIRKSKSYYYIFKVRIKFYSYFSTQFLIYLLNTFFLWGDYKSYSRFYYIIFLSLKYIKIICFFIFTLQGTHKKCNSLWN